MLRWFGDVQLCIMKRTDWIKQIGIHSSFSQTHKIANIAIVANFVMQHIWFLSLFVSWIIFQDYIGSLPYYGKAKTKLAILALLFSESFVKKRSIWLYWIETVVKNGLLGIN